MPYTNRHRIHILLAFSVSYSPFKTSHQTIIALMIGQLIYSSMSSLAAARADGFYRPKNFDADKIEMKKDHDKPFVVVEGQRVGGSKVRYETPFHVRCEGCQNMVAKGVRFNSIKTWVGDFHTTKIYEFRMKCPQCPQRFVVRTDPENCEYLYLSGARRIFQTSDCTDQTRIHDEELKRKMREDPFSKMENQLEDRIANHGFEEHLSQLQEMQERGAQDFDYNRMLRKHAKTLRLQEHAYFREKAEKNLMIPLLPASVEDAVKAERVQFKQDKKKMIKKEESGSRERNKLKEKMRKMTPKFRNNLQGQIKAMNKPTTAFSKH